MQHGAPEGEALPNTELFRRLAARMGIATALLSMSALIIHQSGGMIEMHFHIFAILAFLLLYRDWRVPVAGAVVVAGHHVLFNLLQSQGHGAMIFNHGTGWGIVAVHAGWVVFEVGILVYMARLLAEETRGAEALVKLATRMGDGDLTARADRGAGAVGDAVQAVNQGTERLSEAVRGVRNRATEVADVAQTFTAAADHVSGAAEEVARALGEVSAGSQEQALNTQHMAATLGEMARSIGSVASRSHGAAQASQRAASSSFGRSGRSTTGNCPQTTIGSRTRSVRLRSGDRTGCSLGRCARANALQR